VKPAVRSALLSGIGAGVGLWSALAVLDIVTSPRGTIRVALVPPLWLMPACMVGGALLAIVIARLLTRGMATPSDGPVTIGAADALLPLHAGWLLALPYLPWLPDALPVIRVLAGPAKYAVAAIVLLQVVGAAWAVRRRAPAKSSPGEASSTPTAETSPGAVFARPLVSKGVWAIVAASVLASSLAAARLTDTVLFPSGDEPHYLVIAQSLWRDGDLKIENNHTRGDYKEYFPRDLAPHYIARGKDQQIYSIHPVGLGVVMAPVYALGGYHATVALQMLMAALAIAIGWWWSVHRTGSTSAANWAWAAIALSTPWLINAFTIYPEVAGALCAMTAFVAVTTWPGRATHLGPWIRAGIAVALLPWFSTKYAPMSAALVLVALVRAWRDDEVRVTSPVTASLAVLVPYAIGLATWFAFFHAIWGTFSPSAPYGTNNQTSLLFVRTGGPGLLFDQEYGLLAFAPAAILAFTGLVAMWRAGSSSRRQAIEVAFVAAALIGTVGAFRIWWGGSAGPGRPIISALGLFMLPMTVALERARIATQRAGHRLLVLAGIALAVTIVVVQGGLLIAAGRDGTSGMLEWWSPNWRLTEMAPSYIARPPLVASAFAAVWIVAALAAGTWLARSAFAALGRGRAALTATLTTFGAVLVATMAISASLTTPARTAVVPEERTRTALLDGFDSTWRPMAIRYSPWSTARAKAILPSLVLGARGQQPGGGITVPIALNARHSLPAGRYRARVHALPNLTAPVTGQLGVQIGRLFDPLEAGTVTLGAGATWTQEFTIDVDANFVGIRASREMSRALKEVWFEPLAVEDAHRRVPVAEVVSARHYGAVTAYFHDEQAWPEPPGFWVRGRDEARFVLASASDAPVRLRVTTGPIANHLSIDVEGHVIELDTGADSYIEVPIGTVTRPTRMRVRSRDGFVPIELDPSKRDRRTLGAWIELLQ